MKKVVLSLVVVLLVCTLVPQPSRSAKNGKLGSGFRFQVTSLKVVQILLLFLLSPSELVIMSGKDWKLNPR